MLLVTRLHHRVRWAGALLALWALLAACGGGTDPSCEDPGAHAWLLSVEPAPCATEVAPDGLIKIRFANPIDRNSLQDDMFYIEQGGVIRYGALSFDLGRQEASLYLEKTANSICTAVLSSGVWNQDRSAQMTDSYRWTFEVGNP